MAKKEKRTINMSGGLYNEGFSFGLQVAGNVIYLSDNKDATQEELDSAHLMRLDHRFENWELRRLLITHFNESELMDLCFDFGIDYDSLSGSSKGERVRSLITYVLRHNQISKFMEILQQHRPQMFS